MELPMNVTAYLQSAPSANILKLRRQAHTVTGAVTVTTLPSSINNSLALWHNSRTWASGIGLQARSCAIALKFVLVRGLAE